MIFLIYLMDIMAKKHKHRKDPKTEVEGIISINRRGTGFVAHTDFDDDIEISNRHLNTALNGDTVAVKVLPHQPGKRVNGEITKVVSRDRTNFVGTIEHGDKSIFFKPDDARMYKDILLPDSDARNIGPGIKVYIKMLPWTDSRKMPEGEIIKILGPKGEHEVEMQSIICEHGFDTKFFEEIENEAKRIAKQKAITDEDTKDRRDCRGITTFTIDPHDAKDFDDALSIQTLENGDIEVGIHIADVSHYVQPHGLIDTEARKRATSIYLVDRTIPMLPEILSNDVCSLVPNEDRRTFSAIFILSPNAEVKKKWFGETIIHSNKRFTYEEAQETLNHKKGLLYDELNTLNVLSKKMRQKRASKGAMVFEQDEIRFELDDTGKPIRIIKKKRQDTNLLIEDFMLLANQEVAAYMFKLGKKAGKKDAAFVYRIHDAPDPEKIEELGIFIRAIGYDFDTKGGIVSGREINRLFKQIEGKPEEDLIKTATIRSMAKAVYSMKNIGHFSLAFKYYTHFTSPIRRYPDVMVHRIMKSHLKHEPLSKKELSDYDRMTIKSSQREIEAVKAERDSIKYKQVEYMQDHIGEKFDGVINGITEWGVYVEELETKADGLVRIGSIKGDYFTVEPKKYRIVGEKTKKKYALGDKVKIELVGADLESRQLDFKFV